MRPFRRNSLTEKLIGVLSQLVVIGFSTLFCLWMISGARAAGTVDLVQITPNSNNGVESVELEFNSELTQTAVTPSFDRDFFQLSIAGTSIFPAKTVETKEKNIKKVFSYQYEPGVTRTRIYLGKKADTMKSALSWKLEGKRLVVAVDGNVQAQLPTQTKSTPVAVDNLALNAAGNSKVASTAAAKSEVLTNDEEALLKAMTDRLDKREATAATTAATNNTTTAKAEETKKAVEPPAKAANEDLFSGMKRDPASAQNDPTKAAAGGFGKVFLNLILVLGLIGGVAWGFRKFVLKKGLALGAQNNLIRPISSYSLSPGRSLSIVRIGDEVLVLGVTNSNISLITSLGPDSGIDKFLEPKKTTTSKKSFDGVLTKELERFGMDDFSDVTEAEKPNTSVVGRAIESLGVRDLIRDKVRGFKQLS